MVTGDAAAVVASRPVGERTHARIDFLDIEVTALDAAIAREALTKPEVLRLMSAPGVT